MSFAPTKIYTSKIADGELEHDDTQWHALVYLDQLRDTLISVETSTGWLKKNLDRLARRNREPITGCYMWGGVGTGKTLLMDIFYSSLPEGIAHRTHFHRFMRDIHQRKAAIRNTVDPLGIIASEIATQHKVLCLDEFTVTDITDAMIMHGLLRHLFDNGLTLVTTSNSLAHDLYRNGLQRSRFLPAIELLEKHTRVINVDSGSDYRMNYLKDSSIYHSPADDASRSNMKALFSHLAGPVASQRTTLEINDREIHAKASAPGIAWFDFSELCQTNRSNSDYIELARQFHTIMVSDVPQLDRELEDPARRFIELVDELYDMQVNLVISSDFLPHELYAGKRLVIPFERTASRLVEMSSMEYLARPHAG